MKQFVSFVVLCCLAGVSASAQPRFTGYVGGGPSVPLNPIGSRLDTGWNISAGAGVTGRHAGLLLNFMYNDFAINQNALSQFGAPNGNTRIWAFTLDPVIHLSPRAESPVDFYITGGGGIYHRSVEFTTPTVATVTGFDPWFGFFPVDVAANQVIGSYGVYKAGVDGGVGLSFRLGSSHMKLFTEAKFHHMFTNRVDTNLVPVTIGLRW